MSKKVKGFLIRENAYVKEAMRQMGEIGEKVLFVVDEKGSLLGALSDGDIRKWILNEGDLNAVVYKVCNRSPRFINEDYNVETVKQLMLDLKIECIPAIKNDKQIKEILTWDNIFGDKIPKHKEELNAQVVIMAGGKGTRLDPLTRILPKPLIPIGNKPIIEIIMDKFNEYGIKEFDVCVNHKSRMIKSYFEDINSKYNIYFAEEESPLGTAGGLKLLESRTKDPFLVTNCDIIIESDYSEVVKFHIDNDYDITIVVSCKHYVIPYGVCEIENGGILKSIKEKPGHDLLINTGMYMVNKSVLNLIPSKKFFHITDLIIKAKEKGYKIGVFPISEKSWIDIGQWEEYRKAVENLKI